MRLIPVLDLLQVYHDVWGCVLDSTVAPNICPHLENDSLNAWTSSGFQLFKDTLYITDIKVLMSIHLRNNN